MYLLIKQNENEIVNICRKSGCFHRAKRNLLRIEVETYYIRKKYIKYFRKFKKIIQLTVSVRQNFNRNENIIPINIKAEFFYNKELSK